MKFIIKVFFKVVKSMISLVLLPIDTLISSLIPNLSNAIQSLTNFYNWILTFGLWVKSWLPFNDTFYSFFGAVVIFRITLYLGVHMIKLGLRWYRMLMP